MLLQNQIDGTCGCFVDQSLAPRRGLDRAGRRRTLSWRRAFDHSSKSGGLQGAQRESLVPPCGASESIRIARSGGNAPPIRRLSVTGLVTIRYTIVLNLGIRSY